MVRSNKTILKKKIALITSLQIEDSPIPKKRHLKLGNTFDSLCQDKEE
jgi:hypothetical protein